MTGIWSNHLLALQCRSFLTAMSRQVALALGRVNQAGLQLYGLGCSGTFAFGESPDWAQCTGLLASTSKVQELDGHFRLLAWRTCPYCIRFSTPASIPFELISNVMYVLSNMMWRRTGYTRALILSLCERLHIL